MNASHNWAKLVGLEEGEGRGLETQSPINNIFQHPNEKWDAYHHKNMKDRLFHATFPILYSFYIQTTKTQWQIKTTKITKKKRPEYKPIRIKSAEEALDKLTS